MPHGPIRFSQLSCKFFLVNAAEFLESRIFWYDRYMAGLTQINLYLVFLRFLG